MTLIVNFHTPKEKKFVALLLKRSGYEIVLAGIDKDEFGSILKKNNPETFLGISQANS